MAIDRTKFDEAVRAGATEDQIRNTLRSKGREAEADEYFGVSKKSPTGTGIVPAAPQDYSQVTTPVAPRDYSQMNTPDVPKTASGFIKNVGTSAANFGKGILNAAVHPVDTAVNIGKVALGGVQKLIPGEQSSEVNFDVLTDYFKSSYGSAEAFKNHVYEDPVGFVSDLSTLFGGAGLVAKGISTAGKIGELGGLSSVAGKAAKLAKQASDITDPLQLAMKGAGAGVSKISEVTKGAVPETVAKSKYMSPIETFKNYTADVKMEGSPRVKAIIDDMTGKKNRQAEEMGFKVADTEVNPEKIKAVQDSLIKYAQQQIDNQSSVGKKPGPVISIANDVENLLTEAEKHFKDNIKPRYKAELDKVGDVPIDIKDDYRAFNDAVTERANAVLSKKVMKNGREVTVRGVFPTTNSKVVGLTKDGAKRVSNFNESLRELMGPQYSSPTKVRDIKNFISREYDLIKDLPNTNDVGIIKQTLSQLRNKFEEADLGDFNAVRKEYRDALNVVNDARSTLGEPTINPDDFTNTGLGKRAPGALKSSIESVSGEKFHSSISALENYVSRATGKKNILSTAEKYLLAKQVMKDLGDYRGSSLVEETARGKMPPTSAGALSVKMFGDLINAMSGKQLEQTFRAAGINVKALKKAEPGFFARMKDSGPADKIRSAGKIVKENITKAAVINKTQDGLGE